MYQEGVQQIVRKLLPTRTLANGFVLTLVVLEPKLSVCEHPGTNLTLRYQPGPICSTNVNCDSCKTSALTKLFGEIDTSVFKTDTVKNVENVFFTNVKQHFDIFSVAILTREKQ